MLSLEPPRGYRRIASNSSLTNLVREGLPRYGSNSLMAAASVAECIAFKLPASNS